MFSPASFFLSAAYSESTFLLLSVATLLAARKGSTTL
jgi:Gpi18-like mannosyltransferase